MAGAGILGNVLGKHATEGNHQPGGMFGQGAPRPWTRACIGEGEGEGRGAKSVEDCGRGRGGHGGCVASGAFAYPCRRLGWAGGTGGRGL